VTLLHEMAHCSGSVVVSGPVGFRDPAQCISGKPRRRPASAATTRPNAKKAAPPGDGAVLRISQDGGGYGEGYRPGRVKEGAAAGLGRGLPEKEGEPTNPLLGARGAAPWVTLRRAPRGGRPFGFQPDECCDEAHGWVCSRGQLGPDPEGALMAENRIMYREKEQQIFVEVTARAQLWPQSNKTSFGSS